MQEKLTLFFCLLFLFVSTSTAQIKLRGMVTSVIDGRTIIIDSGNARYAVQLQQLEIPDAGQPIAATLKAHLEKFVLNKMVLVEYTVGSSKMVGKVWVDDIDLSLQFLRDGAACVGSHVKIFLKCL